MRRGKDKHLYFFVGDFKSNTGPGIANSLYKKGLERRQGMLFSMADSKIMRVLEIIKKGVPSDVIVLCSSSKQNLLCFLLAYLFHKKIVYIPHGYLAYERRLNATIISRSECRKIDRFEQAHFKYADAILCVSKNAMNYMLKRNAIYQNKFNYIYDAVDYQEILRKNYRSVAKTPNSIISVGGGVRIKNNLAICKAIEKINNETNLKLTYIVIGLPHNDADLIKSYDFVTYYDFLDYEQVLVKMANCKLYIQNSYFDTFGLAVIQAVLCGCNILISKNVGAKEVFHDLDSGNIIQDIHNINEIGHKITNLIHKENNDLLLKSLNYNKIDYKKVANTILSKMHDMNIC